MGVEGVWGWGIVWEMVWAVRGLGAAVDDAQTHLYICKIQGFPVSALTHEDVAAGLRVHRPHVQPHLRGAAQPGQL